MVAINAASASTQLAGLPFSGPVGAVRVALINGTWVAFPTVEQLEGAVFDMVVAGRRRDDVAIMMVEAEATDKVIELVAGGKPAPDGGRGRRGPRAAKPFIAALCEAQRPSPRRPPGDRRATRCSPTTPTTSTTAVAASRRQPSEPDHRRQAGAQRAAPTRSRPRCSADSRRLRRPGEGDRRGVRSLTKSVRQRILTDHFRIDGRGITDIRAPSAEVEVVPRAHRLGAVRAR